MPEKSSIFGKVNTFRRNHPLWWALIAMFVCALVLAWAAMLFLNVWTNHGDNATVPQVKHLSYREAAEKLRAANLSIEISDSIYDTSIPPGTIVESWPKAGSQVKSGRSVYVTVTAFSPKHVTLAMPVTGVSVRQAVSYLNALGIIGIRFVNVPSEYPDLVEGAHANGRPLGVGSVVPVDASVVLEVGAYTPPAEEDVPSDSISSEQAIADDLSDYSTFDDDDI